MKVGRERERFRRHDNRWRNPGKQHEIVHPALGAGHIENDRTAAQAHADNQPLAHLCRQHGPQLADRGPRIGHAAIEMRHRCQDLSAILGRQRGLSFFDPMADAVACGLELHRHQPVLAIHHPKIRALTAPDALIEPPEFALGKPLAFAQRQPLQKRR